MIWLLLLWVILMIAAIPAGWAISNWLTRREQRRHARQVLRLRKPRG